MNTADYWEQNTCTEASIFELLDHLSDNSYMWITNLNTKHSWCTDQTRDLFGLSSQNFSDFEHLITRFVHPYDKAEYLEGIGKRLNGIDLNEELYIRFCDTTGTYYMFSFHMEAICDENGNPQQMVTVLKNENVFYQIDPVTDLFSEGRFVADLQKELNLHEKFAVLQIHVEGFSTFNLIYGRDFSIRLLQAIALEFIYMMDSDKAVYRLERERFVFILEKADRHYLIHFEKKIRNVLAAGIEVDGHLHSLKIASSAILLDNYNGSVSSIYGQVTYALNHSIRKHQGTLVIFNDEVQTSHGVDFELMKVIHQSVLNNCEGFYVEYQPVVAADTGRIVGAEALVRWKHDKYGVVPPGMFIEWLETDPSMYELGNFVLRTALFQTKELLHIQPDFFINVNLSIRQLEAPEFRSEIIRILDETQFPANQLCLELTERCKDFPIDRLSEEVQYLQSLGIQIAMDDYGTGSASSTIVLNVPMNEIKIDMSFIRDIMHNSKKKAMVQSIVAFAKESNMNTCLEGVETEELQDYLREFDATWFQGYYYSKPIALSNLVELLEE